MICKKVKSNPYYVSKIGLYDLHEEITIMAEEIHKMLGKDISLMSKDSTFSMPLKSLQNFYVLNGIDVVKEVHEAENTNKKEHEHDFEEVSLFEE